MDSLFVCLIFSWHSILCFVCFERASLVRRNPFPVSSYVRNRPDRLYSSMDCSIFFRNQPSPVPGTLWLWYLCDCVVYCENEKEGEKGIVRRSRKTAKGDVVVVMLSTGKREREKRAKSIAPSSVIKSVMSTTRSREIIRFQLHTLQQHG